jgi:A/G-specific adenine glycosylase
VLAEWSGLGYYARARNLRRAAASVVSTGGFPRTAEALRSLPGIGAYTAAAVASIAFGEPVAVVDGNVIRVLARLFALPVSPKAPRDVARVRALADALVPRTAPGDHNQALMELGATVCTPRSPRCGACPLRPRCAAAAEGSPDRYPVQPPRLSPRRLRLAAGLALRGGRLVLVPDRHLVGGHLVVPLVALDPGDDAADAVAQAWPGLAGRDAVSLEPLGTVTHSVLERRYRVELFRVTEGARAGRATVRLVAPDRLDDVPHGGLLRKASSKILG